jgi:hypothetical protein
LHFLSESPEVAHSKKTARNLTLIDYLLALHAHHPICLLIPSADDDELPEICGTIEGLRMIAVG